MKFKGKDGNVVEDILEAGKAFCLEHECIPVWGNADNRCPFGNFRGCREWMVVNPAEAARLMGYEVVEEPTSEQTSEIRSENINHRSENINHGSEKLNQEVKSEDDTGKQKPLTRFDKIKACETPEDMVIALNGNERRFCPKSYGAKPSQCKGPCGKCIRDWLMEEDKPRFTFTEEEVAAAKAIERVFPGVWERIEREFNKSLWLNDGEVCRITIREGMFPSIRPGQSVRLSEIVGKE